MKVIIILVLCLFPLITTAQIDPFSDIEDSLSPAAKATRYELVVPKESHSEKPIEKGLYLGPEFGASYTSFYYKIPFDTATRLFGSEFYNHYEFIKSNNSFVGLTAKLVLTNWLTIDINNSFRRINGIITFYEQHTSNGLWLSRSYKPKEYYSFNLVTNNFILNPNITIDNKITKTFFGIGYGRSTLLSRTGSLNQIYTLKNTTSFYQINLGICIKLWKGIASYSFAYLWSKQMGEVNWNAFHRASSMSVSYALPLFTFKPKTATDPNS